MPGEDRHRWGSGGRRGGRSVSDETRTSYYGLPVIKKPHWKWLIVVYFFVGGISSASYVIASIAQLLGGPDSRSLTRVGRYLSVAAIIPCPILLILDLGRPERFLHMLRVVKLRSPMSVGTWGLTIFGGFCTLSALIQAAEDGLLRRLPAVSRLLLALPTRLISLAGSGFGFFVGGYTGVLLAATAVPLWARNRLLLGPLFLASSMSTAVAAISMVLSLLRDTRRHTLERLERLEAAILLAEVGMHIAALRNSGAVIGRPLRQGRLGRLFRWGVVGAGIVAPLALQARSLVTGKDPSRRTTFLSALFTLLGGFLLRYVMVMGGRASAEDPEATFAFTRRGSRSDT